MDDAVNRDKFQIENRGRGGVSQMSYLPVAPVALGRKTDGTEVPAVRYTRRKTKKWRTRMANRQVNDS